MDFICIGLYFHPFKHESGGSISGCDLSTQPLQGSRHFSDVLPYTHHLSSGLPLLE